MSARSEATRIPPRIPPRCAASITSKFIYPNAPCSPTQGCTQVSLVGASLSQARSVGRPVGMSLSQARSASRPVDMSLSQARLAGRPVGASLSQARSTSRPLVSVAAPASLTVGMRAGWIENEDYLDSVLSMQLAYPVHQQNNLNKHHFRNASSPSFIVLPPHIPPDAFAIWITNYGKIHKERTNNLSQDRLRLARPEVNREESVGTSMSQSAAARRHLPQQVPTPRTPWQENWHLVKTTFCCYDPLDSPLSLHEENQPWYFKWHCLCPVFSLLSIFFLGMFVWGVTVLLGTRERPSGL